MTTPKQTPPLSDFDLYRSHFNQILNQMHELVLPGVAGAGGGGSGVQFVRGA